MSGSGNRNCGIKPVGGEDLGAWIGEFDHGVSRDERTAQRSLVA
jgi:hypothetical protein